MVFLGPPVSDIFNSPQSQSSAGALMEALRDERAVRHGTSD